MRCSHPIKLDLKRKCTAWCYSMKIVPAAVTVWKIFASHSTSGTVGENYLLRWVKLLCSTFSLVGGKVTVEREARGSATADLLP